MYVMTVEVGEPSSFDIQTISVDQACYQAWCDHDSDELYHYLPADTIAVLSVDQED